MTNVALRRPPRVDEASQGSRGGWVEERQLLSSVMKRPTQADPPKSLHRPPAPHVRKAVRCRLTSRGLPARSRGCIPPAQPSALALTHVYPAGSFAPLRSDPPDLDASVSSSPSSPAGLSTRAARRGAATPLFCGVTGAVLAGPRMFRLSAPDQGGREGCHGERGADPSSVLLFFPKAHRHATKRPRHSRRLPQGAALASVQQAP
jgi:hypothetical protein